MHVTKVDCHNFRGIKNLAINLHPKMNLVVGINGAGKSTVLQAITYTLIALLRKIHNSKSSEDIIQVADIHTHKEQCSIQINVKYGSKKFSWSIERTRPGHNSLTDQHQDKLTLLSEQLKQKYMEKKSLPLIVFYSVNRVVATSDASIFMRTEYSENLDVYDNALEGKPNYHNFFKWFKEQNDFINHEAMARTRWIENHDPQLRQRISEIYDEIEKFRSHAEKNKRKLQMRAMRSVNILAHEPRLFFRELSDVIQSLDISEIESMSIRAMSNELNSMLRTIDILSREGQDLRDNLPEILDRVFSIQLQRKIKDKKIFDIMRLVFIFAFDIGLWWLSDDAHSELRKELFTVFESPNHEFKHQIIAIVDRILKKEIPRHVTAQNEFVQNLKYISQAIEKFIPEYTNIRINRTEPGFTQMLVDKNGKEFDLEQLSDGEKNLIALIGDIARRLIIGNPHSDAPLNEPGIVIIDEIDLHLHPKWQRRVMEQIPKVFPNCQFILSSHSPQVISHIKEKSIIVLKNENGEITNHSVNDSYGKNSDRILEDIMDETARPQKIDKEIKDIFKLIQNGDVAKAQEKITTLRKDIGEDGELIKADVLITRREIIGK